MNIIQVQDRLKGLPNEALVNYVEEPMGEVPIYLALGELQRRKEMRERFQASQTPPPSVSEQLVAENKPQQMGLGAMAPQGMMPPSSPTQGVGAPQPQPQMDPRQLAASGIAANPVSNVGGPAMMAKGGIVGYQTGGNIGDIDMSDWSYWAGLKGYRGDAEGSVYPEYTQSVEQVGQYVVTNKDGSKSIVKPGDPGYLTATKELSDEEKDKGYEMHEFGDVKYQAPHGLVESSPIYQHQSPYRGQYQSFEEGRRMDQVLNPMKYRDLKDANEAAEIEIAELEHLKKTGKDISINKDISIDKEVITDAEKLEAERLEAERIEKLKAEADKTKSSYPSLADIFRDLNQDPTTASEENRKMKELFGMDPDFYESARARNINASLIQAGLAIAGGTSANPLENISKGSLPALEAFNKEQSRLTGANRLENLQALKDYRDKQKELRGYGVELWKEDAAAKAVRAGYSLDIVKTAMAQANVDFENNYNKGAVGVYFNQDTDMSQKMWNLLYEKALENLQFPGKVAPPVKLFIPYGTGGKKFDITKPETWNEEEQKYMEQFKPKQ